MNLSRAVAVRALCVGVLLVMCGVLVAADQQEIPVVNGKIGSCSADFTVKDAQGKGIYNAKIDVLIKYGFMSMRKTELEAGTNSDGKARFLGLPNTVKRPLEFTVQKGPMYKTVTDDPGDKCEAKFDVTLQ